MSKVWMITGSSRGLGLEITRAALAAGHQVVATARSAEVVANAHGGNKNLLAVSLDVREPEQAEAAANAAIARFGRVDVLVNNAGYGHLGPFEEASVTDIQDQYETNVFGAMHVTRAVLSGMRERRSGRIFNISSIAGLRGAANSSLYCSSKFALEGWSESIAAELQPLGIWVTAVEPGFFRTDFLDQSSVRYVPVTKAEYRESMQQLQDWMAVKHRTQEGDPAKLAAVLLDLAGRPEQPLHLLMGRDAVEWMQARIERDQKALDEWRGLSTSTDFAFTDFAVQSQ